MSEVTTSSGSGRRVDWRRRDLRDAVIVAVVTVVVFAVSVQIDLYETMHDLAVQHARFGIGEVFMLGMALSVALIVFGCRRIQDLNREIAARRAAESKAEALARHDPLTGLSNRRFFAVQVDEALRRAGGRRLAVLMLDVDELKQLNDRHGQDFADQFLIEFSAQLDQAIEPDVVAARIEGNGFGLLLEDTRSLDDPTRLARALILAFNAPLVVNGRHVQFGIGIGIAVAPDDGVTAEALMRRAALALDRAKSDGRGSVRFYETEMDVHVERRARIEQELRRAVAASAIALHYQPIVNLADGRIIGFEALARWKSPVLGSVPPASFIQIAEECGLMRDLGDQLLRRACRDAMFWPNELRLAFNIAPDQLRDRAFGLRILSILGETGLSPGRLEIEITDRALVDDIDVVRQVIDELRRAGVRVALDGFGTGYATVSQLLALRFDKIKITRGIVHRLERDPKSATIMRAMVGLADALDMVAAAEAIEKPAQLAKLKAAGCIEGQGFLFGKIVPPTEIAALLRAASRGNAAVPAASSRGHTQEERRLVRRGALPD